MIDPRERIGRDYADAQRNQALLEAREAVDPLVRQTGDYISKLVLPVRSNALTVMRNVHDRFGFEDRGSRHLWRGDHWFVVGDKGLLLSSIEIQDNRKGWRREFVSTRVTILSHLALNENAKGPSRENTIAMYDGVGQAASTHLLEDAKEATAKSDATQYASPEALEADYVRTCLAQVACANFIHGVMRQAVTSLGVEPVEATNSFELNQELQDGWQTRIDPALRGFLVPSRAITP